MVNTAKDLRLKLAILRLMIFDSWENWRQDCWGVDLDSHMCCNGDPMYCGCRDATYREWMEYWVEREARK